MNNTNSWYSKVYKNLTESRKSRGLNKKVLEGYYEKHHITPKCLGGKDEAENLVLLTYREHVIVHKLLVKIYPHNKKLKKALTRMLICEVSVDGKKVKKEIKSSREAEKIRKLYVESLTGDGNPNFGKCGVNASHYGYKHSPEARAKISKANKGKLVGEKNPMYGIRLTGDKNPMYGKFGGNHPASKKVIDSCGKVFNSITECANYHKINRNQLGYWIKNNPEKGYSLYKPTNKE